jgi:hypothetical protein
MKRLGYDNKDGKWIPKKGRIHEIVHFRVPYSNGHTIQPYTHIAAVVLKSGQMFWGVSKCCPKDQYNRKLGYTISVGRALSWAAKPHSKGMTIRRKKDRTLPGGFKLRDQCRKRLEEMEILPVRLPA